MPLLIAAIPLSILLTVVSGVIGNLLAVPVALARISPNPLLWVPSYLFILLMRGTPLLIQIYLIYYGLGQVFGGIRIDGEPLMRVLPFLRDGIWYAIFALSINTAGYTGEILRGAIQAVPHGEIEAARARGSWIIYMFHGVGKGTHNLYVDDEEHRKVVEWLDKELASIWTASVVEVAQHLKAAQARACLAMSASAMESR